METEFTPEMIAEAKANPGGWVYQIDWAYPDHVAVPREAIVGGWAVDQSGSLTGEFKENPNYRPVRQAVREPQEYMVRAMRGSIRNQWCVEIDPEHLDEWPDPSEEWHIGVWYVGNDGKFTGQFRANSKYVGNLET